MYLWGGLGARGLGDLGHAWETRLRLSLRLSRPRGADCRPPVGSAANKRMSQHTVERRPRIASDIEAAPEP